MDSAHNAQVFIYNSKTVTCTDLQCSFSCNVLSKKMFFINVISFVFYKIVSVLSIHFNIKM